MRSLGSICWRTFKSRGPLVPDLPSQARYDVRLRRKDLRPALEAASSLDAPLPAAAATDQLYAAAQPRGHRKRDTAAAYRASRRSPDARTERASLRSGGRLAAIDVISC
jgi:3-hydroxyisobutyrate dehydrogenase-like beta-hydroxyacid dehydrogenase